MFSALDRGNLKLNPKKCEVGRSSISALGFILNADGLSADPNNLRKIREWPPPRDVKQVRQFLGLASYYRAHIMGFARLAEPLHDLLVKDKEWSWSEIEKKSFESLKERLFNGSACAYPNFEKMFYLKTDGSGTTVGAVLSKKNDNNKETIIACASQRLNPTERRWLAFDKEYYGLVFGVRQFAHYLRYNRFTVVTDSKPLMSAVNMESKNDASGKRCRWSLEIQTFDLQIVYKSGQLHSDADALARHPSPDLPTDKEDHNDILIAGALAGFETELAKIKSDDDFQT